MSGLLRRIRRPGAAEETRTEASALPEPAHGSAPDTAPVRADGSPLPAGVSPEDLERRGAAGRRGKLRRRARFLRRARELALRDLGGLVYEAHRRDQDGGKLVTEKVQHLGVIDAELHRLEDELGTPRGETVLRKPGVGGTCPRCGELHASDARFCSRCGLDLTAGPAEEPAPEPAAAAPAEPAEAATAAPAEPAKAAPAEPAETATAAPAEPSEAAAPEPSEAAAAAPTSEPAASDAPAAEQPTTDLAPATPQAGNGRASTTDSADTPDPDRSA